LNNMGLEQSRARKRQDIAGRRAQVSEMRFRLGLREREIAERLGVSLGTVAGDIKAIVAEWEKSALRSREYHVAAQWAEYVEMKRDAALEFQREKDPRWMAERTKILQAIADLLGLKAPTKQDVFAALGGPGDQYAADPAGALARLCGCLVAGQPGAVLQDGDSVPRGFASPE
jgi:transposase